MEWESELRGIEIAEDEKEFILTGLHEGFRLTRAAETDELPDTETENYASCALQRAKVELQIQEEVVNGRYVKVKMKPKMVSPLGALPKADGRIRLIHDASVPLERSVNDWYDMKQKIKYDSVEKFCQQIGRGWYMAKVDLQSAFRSVGIHPIDLEATGLKWKFAGEKCATYMQDRRLPFGCRASVDVFHRLSTSVKKMMKVKGAEAVACLLDDFAVAGASQESCLRALNSLIDLLRRLGFSINWKKVECPTQRLQFLGVEIDTMAGTMTLPEEKRILFSEEVQRNCQKTRISKRALQKLCGKLNWVCQVVRVGRAFARPVYSALSTLKHSHNTVRPDKCLKDTLHWWKAALNKVRPVKIWPENRKSLAMETDASLKGAGVIIRMAEGCTDWLYMNWEAEAKGKFAKFHINYLEAAAPLLAILSLGRDVKNCSISIYCDSEAACGMLNRGSSANPTINRLLQTVSLWCISTECDFKAFHVPGTFQIFSDALSRCDESQHLINFCCRMFGSLHFLHFLLGHGISLASENFLALQVLALRSRLALTPATATSSAMRSQPELNRHTAATCVHGATSVNRMRSAWGGRRWMR
jgi:hypothetical protein